MRSNQTSLITRVLFFLLLECLVVQGYSQIVLRSSIDSTKVPIGVRKSIRLSYNNPKDVRWFSIGLLSYEGVFKMTNRCYYVHVRNDGEIIAAKYEIKLKTVPHEVVEIIKQQNSDFKIAKAFISLNDSNKPENYIFYLQNDDENREVVWALEE